MGVLGLCVDMCAGMRVDMCVGMCVGMCVEVCSDDQADVYVRMCMNVCGRWMSLANICMGMSRRHACECVCTCVFAGV